MAAVVADADGNYRADRVRLTFSERVRHRRDVDGSYPFTVVGYRISSVAGASGRSIVIALVERSTLDASGRPVVRYRPTGSKPVTDRAGNQAAKQAFRGTRAHGRRPPVLPPVTPPPAPPPPGQVDKDGDRYPDVLDCAPADPAINPGAADLPDQLFVDSNCDGIDGTEANAIFVSPLGNDANAGTRAAPKREISEAVAVAGAAKAADARRYVLAAEGSYGRVVLASGVGVYGGYDRTSWARSATRVTAIVGAPEGILAVGATDVLLQQLSVRGLNQGAGTSAYGIRAIDGSSLTLQRVTVVAGDGAAGIPGTNGKPGAAGANGGNATRTSINGVGGFNPTAGLGGGRGGSGGGIDVDKRDAEDGLAGQGGALGGKGGLGSPTGGRAGRAGANGQSGRDGTAGVRGPGGSGSTSQAASAWIGNGGSSGSPGGFGYGGGGGGGGGGNSGSYPLDWVWAFGGGGGGGGAGGIFGGRGEGGGAGGGSFGVYLYNSTLVTESCAITSGNGGNGGKGGDGGGGGAGGVGGLGVAKTEKGAGTGGNGGQGGRGGQGGAGGGGAGGPSVAVMKIGSAATLTGTALRIGPSSLAGAAGAGGAGTPRTAEPGIAQAIYP